MKTTVLKSLRMVIPNICGSIFMTDESGSEHMLRDPVCYPPEYLAMENKYLSISEERDYGSWIMQRNQPVIIRSSSLMPEEEPKSRDRSLPSVPTRLATCIIQSI